ncbi:MAG: S-layer y domain protein [Firmicutes bacterium]|nr:S-layer y domain protein [Bacillota bacterium]
MRKQLIVTLMLVFLVGITGTAFAAANPFGDVPANHWSYSAVGKLVKDGIIDSSNFNGDKTITRYEMAQLVARGVWNAEKANAEDKALINKLSAEFSAELSNLGVRGAAPEKHDDKFHLFGVLHVSDQVWNNSGKFHNCGESFFDNDGYVPEIGVDLFLTYKVNDAWKVVLEEEAIRSLRTGGYGASSSTEGIAAGNQHLDQMFAVGKVGETTVTVGKWDYVPGYGAVLNMSDRAVNGVQAAFGNKVVTKLTYGFLRENWTGAPLNSNIISSTEENRYAAAEVNLPLSKTANMKAAYHDISNSSTTRIYEVGADKMLTKDVQLWGTYAKSNFDTQNTEYIAGVNYKRADLNVPGSYRLSARYIDCEKNASVGPSNDWWVGTVNYGIRGPQMNVQYVLDKNIDFQVWASTLSATEGTGKLRTVKAEIDYFF